LRLRAMITMFVRPSFPRASSEYQNHTIMNHSRKDGECSAGQSTSGVSRRVLGQRILGALAFLAGESSASSKTIRSRLALECLPVEILPSKVEWWLVEQKCRLLSGSSTPPSSQVSARCSRSSVGAVNWANIDDHSQIVRFVSSFIADTLTGISRDFVFMVSFYPPMPCSGNNNGEYHPNNGYWAC
jgi:hypothetical protein